MLPPWGAPLPHLREGQSLATVEQTRTQGDLLCSESTWAPTASCGSFSASETPETHRQCLSQLAAELTLELGSRAALPQHGAFLTLTPGVSRASLSLGSRASRASLSLAGFLMVCSNPGPHTNEVGLLRNPEQRPLGTPVANHPLRTPTPAAVFSQPLRVVGKKGPGRAARHVQTCAVRHTRSVGLGRCWSPQAVKAAPRRDAAQGLPPLPLQWLSIRGSQP